MLLKPEIKEQLSQLKEGEKYTLFSFNDFGFPSAMKCRIIEFYISKWAQYEEAIYLELKPYRAQHFRRLVFHPKNELIIWKGWVNANDDPAKSVEEKGGVIIKESRLCFDPEYMQIGLNSVKQKPLLMMNI